MGIGGITMNPSNNQRGANYLSRVEGSEKCLNGHKAVKLDVTPWQCAEKGCEFTQPTQSTPDNKVTLADIASPKPSKKASKVIDGAIARSIEAQNAISTPELELVEEIEQMLGRGMGRTRYPDDEPHYFAGMWVGRDGKSVIDLRPLAKQINKLITSKQIEELTMLMQKNATPGTIFDYVKKRITQLHQGRGGE